MPNLDCVHNSDLAAYEAGKGDCNCNHNGLYWGPACPPFPPPPPDYPFPPFPPCPPHPHPCPDPDVDPEPKKNSIEGQICKLSKKAAAINRMLDNLENKKKDVIIKIGDTSFNFGNIDAEYKDWADTSYAATVKTILEHQRGLIQAEIKRLAEELDEEVDTTAGGTEGAITGN